MKLSSWKRWLSFESRVGKAVRAAPRKAPRPQLETLEDRCLLSASPIAYDLTTRGAEQTVEGAIFHQTNAHPGAGTLHSFVQLESSKHSPIEQGYNTDARPLQFDESRSPHLTRSLHLSQVPEVTIGGKLYLEFDLEINQSASHPLLSLDELQIFLAGSPNLHGYNPGAKTLPGGTLIYNLDATADHYLKLNGRLHGDIRVDVPVPMTMPSGDPFVYLYSKFGEHYGANGGREEWAVRPVHSVPPPAPPPSSLSGFVYVDANNNGVFDPGELSIGGVIITLTGTDKTGHTVNLQVTTDQNGFYSFDNLAAGTYHLAETQPALFADGLDTIGTQSGTAGNDFFDITLASGIKGTSNNFGELPLNSGPPLT